MNQNRNRNGNGNRHYQLWVADKTRHFSHGISMKVQIQQKNFKTNLFVELQMGSIHSLQNVSTLWMVDWLNYKSETETNDYLCREIIDSIKSKTTSPACKRQLQRPCRAYEYLSDTQSVSVDRHEEKTLTIAHVSLPGHFIGNQFLRVCVRVSKRQHNLSYQFACKRRRPRRLAKSNFNLICQN